MQVLSALSAICIIGGTAAISYTVMDMLANWRLLSTMSPWRPATAACVSAGAFMLAWVLHLVREHAGSAD
jgi:hypothetical protein